MVHYAQCVQIWDPEFLLAIALTGISQMATQFANLAQRIVKLALDKLLIVWVAQAIEPRLQVVLIVKMDISMTELKSNAKSAIAIVTSVLIA
jgi:hypothetical protein